LNSHKRGLFHLAIALSIIGCGSLGSGEITGDFSHVETMEKEESELNSLYERDKKNYRAPLGLGWILIHKEKYADAVAMFNKSLKISSKNPRAYMGLGVAYEKLGNYEFCIKSYKQALKLKPGWYYAHYELGKIYHKTGSKQAYFTELDTLVANHPNLANNLLEIIYHQKNGS